MTTMIEPRCYTRKCVHFEGVAGDDMAPVVVCKAFPKDIPDEIAYGDNLHTKPFPGDKGILFKQRLDQVG